MVQRAIARSLPPGHSYQEAFRNATDMFMLQLKLSMMVGLIIAFPVLVLQLWGFVAPGLKPDERKPFKRLAPFAVLLFLLGLSFCWAILPTAIGWFVGYLVNFGGANLIQEPGTIVFFCVKMLFAFGLGFQLPLVVWILGALNLLSGETLMKYWRQGAVAIFILAGIVTPSNDYFSMLVMAVPLTVLFMISVYLVRFSQRRRRRGAEEGDEPVSGE